jgi:hypothetical protein
LAAAVSRLKTALEAPESRPVTETREFTCVSDAALRRILERDYQEIQRAYIATCWKSVIILAGGAIEATLADLLLRHQERAVKATKAPSRPDVRADPRQWDFTTLIDVAVELELVSVGVEKLSHAVRGYRNLVHPGNEIRTKLTFGAEEARIAIEVLNMVHRDLSKAQQH